MDERFRAISHMRLLIVDDEPTNVFLLERILEKAGFPNYVSTRDPAAVCDLCEAFQPDILLLDMHMPGMTGLDVMRELKPWLDSQGYLPILVLTADTRKELKEEALRSGAKDFITKPFDQAEALQRIANLLETRQYHNQLASMNKELEERVRERTAQLEAAQVEIVNRLGLATNLRDDQTGDHVERVGQLCYAIAREVGLPEPESSLIGLASKLHDVGKIGVPDDILLKPGKLDALEFERMRAHTSIGAEILAGADSEVLIMAETIALTHHEKWDGTGYPKGLAGEEIPLAGRICAVADVFDSLTSQRPYKSAWTRELAIEEIVRCSGTHFDPDVVQAFLRLTRPESRQLAA